MLYILYILLAILVALFGLFVVFIFYRNRFEGDLTPAFVTTFTLAFFLSMAFSLFLMGIAGITPPDDVRINIDHPYEYTP